MKTTLEKDLIIAKHLRSNGRKSLTKLSKQTKIPVSTIFDRLKSNADNLIIRHTCLIDFAKLGYVTRANIAFKIDKSVRDKFKDHLKNHERVNTLYKINNGFDYMVEGIFKNIKEIEDFVEHLEEKFKIKQKQVYYIIEDLAREKFMSTPALASVN